MTKTMKQYTVWTMLMFGVCLSACTPTVQLSVPDKPIEINLNVKIEHEIRVRVDNELDELFKDDSDLF